MTIKLAAAALAAFAAFVPAAYADAAHGDVVIKLDKVDASDPAAIQQVLGKIHDVAVATCRQTGSRLASQACVTDFVTQAIDGVHRSDLRLALARANNEEGGTSRAVADLPQE